MKYNLFVWLLLILLIASCGRRKITKTVTTTTRQTDSVLVIPQTETTFISKLPKTGDSIVLTDRKTGVELTIKEFFSVDDILAANPVTQSKPVIPNAREESQSKKHIQKTEYEFKITEPEKKIPIKINEKIIEENKTVTVTQTPWYYKLSLKIVIFLIVLAIGYFLLKKFF